MAIRNRNFTGRVNEIEILGSKKNIILKGNKDISKVFSENYIYSTCFLVETEFGDDGTPVEFTFHGTGYGNGAGMCLVGAAAMANKGKNFKSIIDHYYNDVQIKKIY